MKIKYANRADWKRIRRSQFRMMSHCSPSFTGIVALFHVEEVRAPLWIQYGDEHFRIVDDGYYWLQHFPKGENYVVTTILTPDDTIVQWYIDICQEHGVTAEGLPWLRDLYLDLVISPSEQYYILDADELDEALERGAITRRDYQLAWQTMERLLARYKRGRLTILDEGIQHYMELKGAGI